MRFFGLRPQNDVLINNKFLLTHLPTNLLTRKRRVAFTLAEVLITLGIIGVVAAMTMPTLIQNHQKQAYVTGFKRSVAVIDNMFKKMQADEGVSSFWDTELSSQGNCMDGSENGCEDWYGNPSVFERIIPKYIKTVKVCKGFDCSVRYSYSKNVTKTSDNKLIKNVDYSNLEKNQPILAIMEQWPYTDSVSEKSILGFYTNDGAIYYISPGGKYFGALIAVDSNGQKGPNMLGRDLYTYSYINGKSDLSCSRLSETCVYANTLVQNGWKMDY